MVNQLKLTNQKLYERLTSSGSFFKTPRKLYNWNNEFIYQFTVRIVAQIQ
jgi:hypothetical protein